MFIDIMTDGSRNRIDTKSEQLAGMCTCSLLASDARSRGNGDKTSASYENPGNRQLLDVVSVVLSDKSLLTCACNMVFYSYRMDTLRPTVPGARHEHP
jgi:hypothetical protein